MPEALKPKLSMAIGLGVNQRCARVVRYVVARLQLSKGAVLIDTRSDSSIVRICLRAKLAPGNPSGWFPVSFRAYLTPKYLEPIGPTPTEHSELPPPPRLARGDVRRVQRLGRAGGCRSAPPHSPTLACIAISRFLPPKRCCHRKRVGSVAAYCMYSSRRKLI
eukprot:COSAG06_NODE_16114_length_1021_cov_1.787419_1_plen_163_part_00